MFVGSIGDYKINILVVTLLELACTCSEFVDYKRNILVVFAGSVEELHACSVETSLIKTGSF